MRLEGIADVRAPLGERQAALATSNAAGEQVEPLRSPEHRKLTRQPGGRMMAALEGAIDELAKSGKATHARLGVTSATQAPWARPASRPSSVPLGRVLVRQCCIQDRLIGEPLADELHSDR